MPPPQTQTASDTFFLSYSRSDERFALRFATDLRANGVAMWIDQLDIRPSEHWDRAIERAVRDCSGMLVILSPRSVASDNVADEISFAIDSRKTLLPVMIEKCTLPLRITRMHLIDATGNYERALQQCLTEIKRGGNVLADAGVEPAAITGGVRDPDILSLAKRQLTTIIGPIAGILVDKTASQAASAREFYDLLASHIDDERDRARFMESMSRSDPAAASPRPPVNKQVAVSETPISSVEVDRIAGVLTSYLGPIASIVTKRESRVCGSLDDLRQQLAALIPDERDRADFFRRLKVPERDFE